MAEAAESRLTISDLKTVLKALYKSRTKWYYVGLDLGVPEDVLEDIEKRRDDLVDCLREMLKVVLKREEPVTWRVVVEALRSPTVGLDQLAEEVEAKYCPLPTPDTAQASVNPSTLSALESKLQTLRCTKPEDAEEVDRMHRFVVNEFLSQSQQSGAMLKDVQITLHELHQRKYLFSESVLHWAIQKASKLFSAQDDLTLPDMSSPQSPVEVTEPLFCKDTLYHAGLCCEAVTTCTAGDYQKFFKNVPGHSFDAVSFSRPRQDGSLREHYLIATQGESKYYIAFQSEPNLTEWPKKCNSFIQGIQEQSEKFPVHFIVELLNKRGSRIILTGFSLGGLLACAVTAAVWRTPYIRTDVLKKSLVCITFGQPHIALPCVSEVAREQPEVASTIHTIHHHDDVIPCIFSLLNECCSDLCPKEKQGEIKLKTPSTAKLPFQDPLTLEVLDLTWKLQDLDEEQGTECLSKLKSVLTSILPHVPAKRPEMLISKLYTAHRVLCEPHVGLVMREMSHEEVELYSNCPLQMEDVKTLPNGLYQRHEMPSYADKIFHAFLEKPQAYKLPASCKSAPPEVPDLKPTLRSVQLHDHGNELAVVVEGSNMWFSYRISLQGIPVKSIPSVSSECTIHFNLKGEGNSVTVEDGKVKVTLHSHFSRAIKELVTVQEKEHHINTRQRQLAVLTPSRLIELAYLSALLEQYPFSTSQPVSRKVEVITAFLERVVQVVPLESIGYAIAYSEYPLALHSTRALLESQIKLPASKLMEGGLCEAVVYMQGGGVSQQVLLSAKKQLEAKLKNYISPFQYEFSVTHTAKATELDVRDVFSGMSESLSLPPSEPPKHVKDLDNLSMLQHAVSEDYKQEVLEGTARVICGLSIEQLYSVRHKSVAQQTPSSFNPPLSILRQGNDTLTTLAKECMANAASSRRKNTNSIMLQIVNEIRQGDLAVCTALLGGFMEQQEIDIPLVKSRKDRSMSLNVQGPASVGVWALSSLKYADIGPMLSKCRGDQLLVKIENSVKAILERESLSDAGNEQYAAKLQFMVQGLERIVTCNSQYISYSLERQLSELCTDRKINSDTPLNELIMKWGILFKDHLLSHVAHSHHQLIACWLKWALMVHHLRESLAKYTAVGVVGLVNSGKSTLVNTLFKIPIRVGTTEERRTTVPLMYNLDGRVDGLDVVDFPGVDDMDETIPDLAELLLFLGQIVIFVVEYKRVHTESAKKWLSKLQEGGVPVLVCLTFADKLYAEIAEQICGKDSEDYPPGADMKHRLSIEMKEILKKLQPPQSHKVQFFCFDTEWKSIFRTKEGKEKLREVGIGTSLDVGKWLVEVFRERFDQEELADSLEAFLHQRS